MEHPDLGCQAYFSLFKRFPSLGVSVVDQFVPCCFRIEELVYRPERVLCISCSHKLSDTFEVVSRYERNSALFSLERHLKKQNGACGELRDRIFISFLGTRVHNAGVHFQSRDDVRFWLDVGQRIQTLFVSALFSENWEAWTQLLGSACSGVRFNYHVNPKTFFSVGVESSRTEVSAVGVLICNVVSGWRVSLYSMATFSNIKSFFMVEKHFALFSVRYIQDWKSCAVSFLFSRGDLTAGLRIQRSAGGLKKILSVEW